MSDKSPEKIWNFESPEDLATALDSKNKTLAEKIRKISKDSIANNSKDLRKALQDELSDQEQKEIREALPDAWVSEVFTKWMTADEQMANAGKVALAWAIGKENAEILEKWEWLWNRVSTWIDKIWDIFDQKWMMAWFWAIIVMLKWIFSGDFTELDKILNPKKDDENAPNISQWREKNMDENLKKTEYILWVKALYLMSGKKIVKDSDNVLLTKEFRENSYSKLKNEIWNKIWISKRLLLKSHTDEQAISGIEILIWAEEAINNLLKETPDWKEKPIEELINLINQKWWKTLSKMTEKVSSLDISIWNPVESFEKALGGMHDMIDIKQNEKWEINFWELESRKGIISNVSPSTISNIIIVWKETTIKTNDNSGNTLESITSGWTEKDKEFIWNLFNFKNNIVNSISNIFPNKNKGEINTFFSEKWFTLKELFELYLITWWKTDINNLDWISQTLFYIKLWKVFWKKPEVRAIYNVHLFQALSDKAENIKLPQEVKNFLGNISSLMISKFTETAKAWLKEIYNTLLELPWEKQVLIWWLLTAFVLWVYYSRWLLVRLSFWLSATAMAAAIFAIAKSEFEAKWITENKIENALNEELK